MHAVDANEQRGKGQEIDNLQGTAMGYGSRGGQIHNSRESISGVFEVYEEGDDGSKKSNERSLQDHPFYHSEGPTVKVDESES